jgi:hypothetical protein
LFYLGLLWSHDSGHGFERLAHVNLGRSNMLLSQYLLKKYVILNFFESKYIFTSLSGCLWTHRVDRVISVHLLFFYLCLKFELHNFKLVYLWIWIWIEVMFVELIFWNIYIYQQYVYWELSFIIYFDLLYLGLLWSHDLGHGFGRLTRVNPICCYLNIFFKKMSSWTFLNPTIFLPVVQVVFGPIELIRSYQFNSHIFTCVWNLNCIISS